MVGCLLLLGVFWVSFSKIIYNNDSRPKTLPLLKFLGTISGICHYNPRNDAN